ncbi:hypothetical protein [Agrobacterium sp. LMR679]|uniref:hypothetical protein n=1 Tax=Agrobacterium sp. LMR679 TaxID=3014335 RepID=UPI0022AEDD96|nr:hypothetical protein [Agrobacterium sp. LMR679]MCZ4076300.1 hypothetical protein [Agrobacterium sp. LMR679]
MIQLPNVTDLPASRSAGPESWGEAWSKAAGATDETMRLIENTNADYYGLEKAYDERIKLIADITGQTLPNPMREAAAVDLDPDRADVMAMSLGGGGTAFSSVDEEGRASREEEFNAKALSLSGKYRQELEQVLSTSVEEAHNQVMRDAEKASQEALNSPELGRPDVSARNSSVACEALPAIRHNGAWRCSERVARRRRLLLAGSARRC